MLKMAYGEDMGKEKTLIVASRKKPMKQR